MAWDCIWAGKQDIKCIMVLEKLFMSCSIQGVTTYLLRRQAEQGRTSYTSIVIVHHEMFFFICEHQNSKAISAQDIKISCETH